MLSVIFAMHASVVCSVRSSVCHIDVNPAGLVFVVDVTLGHCYVKAT